MFKFLPDDALGIIRVETIGLHSLAEVRSFAFELSRVCIKARLLSNKVLILIVSDGTVQQSGVIDELAKIKIILGERDRMAVVLPSSLSKLQARRGFYSDQQNAFISASAALQWLTTQV